MSKDDDLSADSDSDTMDVDTVSQDDRDDKSGEGGTGKSGGGARTKGGVGVVTPEPFPHFAVSFETLASYTNTSDRQRDTEYY